MDNNMRDPGHTPLKPERTGVGIAAKPKTPVGIQDIRAIGSNYCQTDGSEHYRETSDLEPIDLIIAKGMGEDFCLANIIKYATRFKKTRNLNDLKKVADYAHIAVGMEIVQRQGGTK